MISGGLHPWKPGGRCASLFKLGQHLQCAGFLEPNLAFGGWEEARRGSSYIIRGDAQANRYSVLRALDKTRRPSKQDKRRSRDCRPAAAGVKLSHHALWMAAACGATHGPT
ncbi:hypothetical protein CIHG_02764 [Coccidioides immitis H538.4]|uniref:Uncharacterized protein n=1 Tax=Coccidioides immitis H538.4 TaxID=396776 RepID=A0A0J8RJZ6_COCIT|nr:hypothetical protein CIHG_02764 [Coccidioides immitis H538.4]